MTVREILVVLVSGIIAAADMSAAAAEPTRDYVVQEGDTCLAIASRELGDPKKLKALHRLNPGLGKTPHALKKGQILKLPVETQIPEAALTFPRGQVEVRKPGKAEWTPGAPGQGLFRSWRVGTRKQSSARVLFADASMIELREDTVVVIFGGSSTTRKISRTTLERGALRSRLALLDGKPRLTVKTPAGTAELTDGSSVIDVDAAGETKLANHTGRSAKLAGRTGRAVVVGAGYGSKVAPGKPPAPPTPLPPPPSWVEPAGLMLGWDGDPIPVRGEWTPVARASKYRLEIVRTDAPDAIEARLEVPASILRLDASNLPVADYEIRVATVDEQGLEGVASEPRRVRVVGLVRPAALVIGAEVATPPDLRCAAGRTASDGPSAQLLLVRDDDGLARITCTSGSATSTLEFELPEAKVASGVGTRRVRAGETLSIELEVISVAPGAIRATGRGGIEVLTIEPTGRGVRLSVRASTATPDAAVIVAIADTAVPLATIGIAVETPPPPPAVVPAIPRRPLLTATGLVGTSFGRLAGDDPLVGAELAVDTTRWLAAHLTVSKPLDGRLPPGYLLGATFKIPGALRPLARLGASFEDDRVGGHVGLGLETELAPWLVVRMNMDAIGDRVDGRIHASLGLAARH